MKITTLFARLLLAAVILTALLPFRPARAQTPPPALDQHVYLPFIGKAVLPTWIGPTGGSVVDLAAASDGKTLYLGLYGGGVYKSVDRGQSWKWSGLGLMLIETVAIDPTNPQIIYVGTHSEGIYKTSDGGVTWQARSNGIQSQTVIYSMAVNPFNPQIVYAGTRHPVDDSSAPWEGILYRSTDGGASWQRVLENVGGAGQQDWVYSIAPSPSVPGRVLIATHEHGPYLATNYGGPGDWQPVAVPNPNDNNAGRMVLFDPRPEANRAYYATWHNTSLFLSTNNGATWKTSYSPSFDVYPNAFSIRPDAPDQLVIASMGNWPGAYFSNNASASWSGPYLTDQLIYSTASLSGSNEVLVGTMRNGVFRTANQGAAWEKSSAGLSPYTVTGLAFHGENEIFASTAGLGLRRSFDGGLNWGGASPTSAANFAGVYSLPANSNIIFALGESSGLYRIDLGATGGWKGVLAPERDPGAIAAAESELELEAEEPLPTPFPSPLDDPANPIQLDERPAAELEQSDLEPADALLGLPVLTLAFDPHAPSTVYAGTGGAGVQVSRDAGITWASLGLNGVSVRAIAVDPDNSQRIFAATNGSGDVRLSTNGGANWSQVLLNGRFVYALAFQDGKLYAGTGDGVWAYNGSAWSAAGLAGMKITELAVRPNHPGELIAGGEGGVWLTKNSGANWAALSPELTGWKINALVINPAQPNYLYAATNGRGASRWWLGK